MRAYFLMCNCQQRTTLMYVILMYSKGTYAKKGGEEKFFKRHCSGDHLYYLVKRFQTDCEWF